jgi:hypothetical protein
MALITHIRTQAGRLLLRGAETRHRELIAGAHSFFVVCGFPRSGTSLIGQLLASAGVYFGERADLMAEDARNPRGYFEHKKVLGLSRAFLREAGITDELIVNTSLRSKGLGRISRLFTRRAMLAVIDSLIRGAAAHPAGMKLFPLQVHIWRPYLPQAKFILVYRHPRAVASSFLSAWPGGFYTDAQLMELWARHNQDALSLLARFPGSVVVKYEDLLDPALRPGLVDALAERIGLALSESVIDGALNRSTAQSETFISSDAQNVLDALDAVRLRP